MSNNWKVVKSFVLLLLFIHTKLDKIWKEKMYCFKYTIISIVFILNINFNDCQNSGRSDNKFHKNWKFTSCDKNNVDECSQVLFLYGYPDLDKILAKTNEEMRPYCQWFILLINFLFILNQTILLINLIISYDQIYNRYYI